MKKIKLLFIFIIFQIVLFGNVINIDTLEKKANIENKNLLFFFHMDYCPYCEMMIRQNFTQKDLANLKHNFTFIDINISDNDTIIYQDFKGSKKEFARRYEIYLFPTVIFINDGEVAYKVRGYRKKAKFNHILNYIKSKSYEDETIGEFIEKSTKNM
jgi:thioredoxin-related protein